MLVQNSTFMAALYVNGTESKEDKTGTSKEQDTRVGKYGTDMVWKSFLFINLNHL